MGEALLVNPYDEESLSATIARALSISETEKRERMMALYRRVHKNNVFAWGDRFIKNLTTAVQTRSERPHDDPLPLERNQLLDAFDRAQDRKSTRLNSSHLVISYAVFCLKKTK